MRSYANTYVPRAQGTDPVKVMSRRGEIEAVTAVERNVARLMNTLPVASAVTMGAFAYPLLFHRYLLL